MQTDKQGHVLLRMWIVFEHGFLHFNGHFGAVHPAPGLAAYWRGPIGTSPAASRRQAQEAPAPCHPVARASYSKRGPMQRRPQRTPRPHAPDVSAVTVTVTGVRLIGLQSPWNEVREQIGQRPSDRQPTRVRMHGARRVRRNVHQVHRSIWGGERSPPCARTSPSPHLAPADGLIDRARRDLLLFGGLLNGQEHFPAVIIAGPKENRNRLQIMALASLPRTQQLARPPIRLSALPARERCI